MIYLNIIKSKLGEVIKDLRKARNLSQEELANLSELHINTIYLLEKGKIEAKISTLLFLAKGLQLELDTFCKLFLKKFDNQ